MERQSTSRRNFLRASAVTGVSAVSIGLSGCASNVPFVGSGGVGNYADWLYAPDELGSNNQYQFSKIHPSQVLQHESELSDEGVKRVEELALEPIFSEIGLDTENLSRVLGAGTGVIASADFSRQQIAEEIEDADIEGTTFDEETEYQGFTVFLSESGSKDFGFALGDSRVIFAGSRGSNDAEDVMELIIDAKRGETERYQDESDLFSALISNLGNGNIMSVRTFDSTEFRTDGGRLDNVVGNGYLRDVQGDTTVSNRSIAFASPEDANVNDVRDYLEAQSIGTMFDGNNDPELDKDGQVVTLRGQMDTSELFTE